MSYATVMVFALTATAGFSYDTSVHIEAWNSIGQRIDKVWVTASALDGGQRYVANGRDISLALPTGEYILKVEAPGFQQHSDILLAYQPTVFRSVQLSVASLHGRTPSKLTGTINNYSGDLANLRVRLIGLYGVDVREARVDAHGQFGFPVNDGPCILLVLADGSQSISVVKSEVFNILGDQDVSIDAGGKPASALSLKRQAGSLR